MSTFEMKLPDVGEGVAEAELVEWWVGVGDDVTPETVVAEVLTDKATVEVSSPVAGRVASLHGEPGDVLAVGGALIGIEVDARADAEPESESGSRTVPDPASGADTDDTTSDPSAVHSRADAAEDVDVDVGDPGVERTATARATAAPAVRGRARSLGIDLDDVSASGPDGRVLHEDLDRVLLDRSTSDTSRSGADVELDDRATTVPVRGLRRRIAERLSEAWREIPHITYVDEVDVTELERLRGVLNQRGDTAAERITPLAFVVRAVVLAAAEFPEVNAHFDATGEVSTTFGAVHAGIATQTDDGLRVAVVRHAETRTVAELASDIARVSGAARDGSATREDLTGSTITVTSLGAVGGIVTTPIVNPPEVAIVGVNKMTTRPVWLDGEFRPRQMLNLSSSFDHRIIDGWVAAMFVQHLKASLETPALLFLDS